MTSVLISTSDATVLAARAVVELLDPVAETTVTPTRDVSAFTAPASALVASVEGARRGELTLVVLDAAWPAGASVPDSVRRALDAAAAAVGCTVVAGGVQALDPGLAVNAVLADPSSTVTRLDRGTAVVGVLAARLSETGAAPAARTRNPLAEIDPARLHMLRGVEMGVTVEIGRTRMTVGELLGLTEGAVVELDRPAGAPADLLVNGRLIARGEIVVIDESFALRITDIVAADEER